VRGEGVYTEDEEEQRCWVAMEAPTSNITTTASREAAAMPLLLLPTLRSKGGVLVLFFVIGKETPGKGRRNHTREQDRKMTTIIKPIGYYSRWS
jgi:hypothetical protein